MTPAEERIIVDAQGAHQRLDRYLTARGMWGSRSRVQRLIAGGYVRLGGRPVKAGTILRSGEAIEVRPGLVEPPMRAEPEAIPLDILYEDDWLLAINKPAGMVVHPAPGHWQGTLVSALLHHWRTPPAGLDPLRPGIVHRLDKDTSGVLIIAKDADTLARLAAQFRNREVEKEYVACVWGRMRAQSGTIAEPIGRNPVHRKRMAVRPGGRAALTRFTVLRRYHDMTLVRLFPKTGRTHQIRVHLAAVGHPIVGDAVYGRSRHAESRSLIQRQALHAERLAFRHPCSGTPINLVSPLPEDMRALQRRCEEAA